MDLLDQFVKLFADFTDPKKRVFAGYLGISILIAFGWLLLVQKASIKKALARIFDRKVFLSRSAGVDYSMFVINRIMFGFISPLLLGQMAVAVGIYIALLNSGLVPAKVFEDLSKPLVVTLFSVTMFLADDLSKYLLHRWMHRWPILWSLHKVHHSAETLNPVTIYRNHPLEGVIALLRTTVVQGTVISLFYYLFDDSVSLFTIIGVNVLVFAFHVSGSNLRHSHIDIRYPRWIEHILISPCQHQLHHSIAEEHYDKNFGSALAIWDWMFGSLHVSEKEKDLKFGLLPSEGFKENTLWEMYVTPVRETGQITFRAGTRVKNRVVNLFSRPRSSERGKND